MKKYSDIFAEDIEVPDIVLRKAEDAFACIRTEDTKNMTDQNKFEKKKSRLWKGHAAAAACVCILVLGSITAAASIHHFWSRGMQGTLHATDKQQQTLTDQGVAAVLKEEKNYEELSVTDGNITVTPETVIADDKFAHISFSVKGYTLGENTEPSFEYTDVYLGEDQNNEDSLVNMNASFYCGIIPDENGHPVYDDGTPMQSNADGSTIYHYTDENGNLEYIVTASIVRLEDSLTGKTLHVNLKNIGTVSKAEYKNAVDGNWNFAIDLPDQSSAKGIQVDQAVDGTVFEIDTIDLSPISIRINYTVNGETTVHEDENGIPYFCGVILKDGTRLPYLGNGGGSGYTDKTKRTAYLLCAFDRIIEPDQVASVLLKTDTSEDMTEVPLN